MRQDLKREKWGRGLRWSFHQNIPDSLGAWVPRAEMELPPEHISLQHNFCPKLFSFTPWRLVILTAFTSTFAYKPVFETISSDSDLGEKQRSTAGMKRWFLLEGLIADQEE